jgi:hypothetical protein
MGQAGTTNQGHAEHATPTTVVLPISEPDHGPHWCHEPDQHLDCPPLHRLHDWDDAAV